MRLIDTPVGAFAFSPGDRHLAWAEGPRRRVVHVVELASWRAVATLEGSEACALQWASPEVLRVLRRAGRDGVMHLHAIPGGDELARAALPGVGTRPLTIDGSADGGAALLGALTLTTLAPHSRAVTWRVRDAFDDAPTPFDPFALAGSRLRDGERFARCAMGPDGATVAVALTAGSTPTTSSGGRVGFVSVSGDAARWHTVPGATYVGPLRWVDPSRVIVSHAWNPDWTEVDLLHTDGARVRVADVALPDALDEGSLDVHPDRALLVARVHRDEGPRGGCSTWAALIPLAPSPREPRLTPLEVLSRWGAPSGVAEVLRPGSGAAWLPDGGLLELASDGVEARLTRRDVSASYARWSLDEPYDSALSRAAPHELARVPLVGLRPHELALTASPGGARVAVTWLTFDRGPADRVRRLAVVPVGGRRDDDETSG